MHITYLYLNISPSALAPVSADRQAEGGYVTAPLEPLLVEAAPAAIDSHPRVTDPTGMLLTRRLRPLSNNAGKNSSSPSIHDWKSPISVDTRCFP